MNNSKGEEKYEICSGEDERITLTENYTCLGSCLIHSLTSPMIPGKCQPCAKNWPGKRLKLSRSIKFAI